MRGPPRQHRLPLAPLLAAAHVGTPGQLAEIVFRHPGLIYHYATDGVPMFAADKLACCIGLHPASIWPEWFEIEVPA